MTDILAGRHAIEERKHARGPKCAAMAWSRSRPSLQRRGREQGIVGRLIEFVVTIDGEFVL